jgi:hypothetical protein
MWDDLIESMLGKIKAFANKGREALEWVGLEFEEAEESDGPSGRKRRRGVPANPADLAKRRASLRAGARRMAESRGAGSTINFKGDDVAFNVTRRAGESEDEFVDRVMAKYEARLEEKRRHMRDNLKSGVKR